MCGNCNWTHEHEYADFVVCPHCGHEHRDWSAPEDDFIYTGSVHDCEECEEKFVLFVNWSVSYTTSADIL